MSIKRKSGTIVKLETLAKQINFYRDRSRVYYKMHFAPAKYLNVHCRITLPGASESGIVDLQLAGIEEKVKLIFAELGDTYRNLSVEREEELKHIIRMHFPEKTAQDKILLRFLPEKREKGIVGPKTGITS